jgi:hypothetical protein
VENPARPEGPSKRRICFSFWENRGNACRAEECCRCPVRPSSIRFGVLIAAFTISKSASPGCAAWPPCSSSPEQSLSKQHEAKTLHRKGKMKKRKQQRPLNKASIVFNLEEALEELTSTLDNIKNAENYSNADFRVAMEHLYHHINFAWNTRNMPAKEVGKLDGRKFYKWRRFPPDINLAET